MNKLLILDGLEVFAAAITLIQEYRSSLSTEKAKMKVAYTFAVDDIEFIIYICVCAYIYISIHNYAVDSG